MALSAGPLRDHFTTPKKLFTKLLEPQTPKNTPECFKNVHLETPSSAHAKRRRSSKEKFDQISNLTVAVRIRPMNTRELSTVSAVDLVRVDNQELTIRSSSAGNAFLGLDHVFHYDHVFWSCDETSALYAGQEDVFRAVGQPLLSSAFNGYNACLFAYGQTGSGKSFSMMGRSTCDIADIDSEAHSGLTPRFCRALFARIGQLPASASAAVEVSYFEIYNEKIHDLLAASTPAAKMALKVREHPEWGPYVVDLSVHPVASYEELRHWLVAGNRSRATAATTMNEKSSRSHSIFSIELCVTDEAKGESGRRSKVSLVDLAGSERIGGSSNNEEKMRQGVCINKSLLTLGKVITALADQKTQFVPYRDSVLTWLLRESLGGNSLTSMLATITPASTHLDETLATLRYACQARAIVNRARINENPHDRLIRELKSEVQRLKALKQDYERNSIGGSSTISFNDSAEREELENLRAKLVAAEGKLLNAEDGWRRRFMDARDNQLRALAESEKRREELESRMRVLKTVDTNLDLSLYKTNFLEELEGVLGEEEEGGEKGRMERWCRDVGLKWTCSATAMTLIDVENRRQTHVLLKDLKRLSSFENISDYVNGLTWSDLKQTKKMNKSEIMTAINQIYQALNQLQPNDDDNQLNLIFAKVNKSVQSFEAALLNQLAKTNAPKSVTFNL